MNTFPCIDCNNTTEFYMLEDEVWLAAVPDYHARRYQQHVYCCLSCVETRLGRKLTTKDFTNAKINSALFWGYSLAKRERFEEGGSYGISILAPHALSVFEILPPAKACENT